MRLWISADTKHPREAYEALKYFTWSADGWKYKLANKDEIEAIGKDSDKSSVSGLAPTVVDNCPITLDESVWKSYEKQYPTTAVTSKDRVLMESTEVHILMHSLKR